MLTTYQNPIVKGFNPDPSICRVGDDFYLVNSSFDFFPGLPIYHSKNLVDWELINYCLTDNSQLDLSNPVCSKGLYAPTIRYHDGMFYVVCTNVSHGGNFIIHTSDIRGKWSAPQWIDQSGIDPSLFFDDDGKCYFCNASSCCGMPATSLFELNPLTGERIGQTYYISRGAGGKHPEGPHIYKTRGYYYLMLAEGGTEYGHMITIFRSRQIHGPYTPCPRNPILSHKDDSASLIQAVGHGDMIEDQNHNWWMVCLGIRKLKILLLHNLGRETFLCPVKWGEDGWPVAGNNGEVAFSMEGMLPGACSEGKNKDFRDDFTGTCLKRNWNFIRNPENSCYRIQNQHLHIQGTGSLTGLSPSFTGIRQTEFCQTAETEVCLEHAVAGDCGGIVAYYNKSYFYALSLLRKDNSWSLQLKCCLHGIETHIAQTDYDRDTAKVRIVTDQTWYEFFYDCGGKWVSMGRLPTAGLCSEGTMMMTFTGTYLGVFSEQGQTAFSYFSVEDVR